MSQKIAVLLFLISSLSACNKNSTSTEAYFLAEQFTEQGIINKYYVTEYPKSQRDIKTGLEYRYIQKLDDSLYSQYLYNPAFKLQSSKQFVLKDKHAIETKYSRFYPSDTFSMAYVPGKTATYITFDQDTVFYTAKFHTRDSMYVSIEQSSKFIKDTIIESKPAKILEKHRTSTSFYGGKPKDTSDFHIRTIYVQNIGLWKSTVTSATAIKEAILVKQLSPKHFDSLSNHTIKRVGYIDFSNTIDKDFKLELCSSHEQIVDYYNGANNRSGFIGGKGNLKKFVAKKLDANKLKNQSGYLTFRFVINCQGQPGKFITNEADLTYNKKQFSEDAVTHLYEIISSVKKWKPCIIRDIERDSYFYVTFILNNGKIQDILP